MLSSCYVLDVCDCAWKAAIMLQDADTSRFRGLMLPPLELVTHHHTVGFLLFGDEAC